MEVMVNWPFGFTYKLKCLDMVTKCLHFYLHPRKTPHKKTDVQKGHVSHSPDKTPHILGSLLSTQGSNLQAIEIKQLKVHR